MKRGLKIGLVILITVFNGLICFGQVLALENEDDLKTGINASLWLDLRTSHSVKGVKNVPLKIRDVPIHLHPYDEWLRENGGPIEDDNVEIPQEVDWLSASLGVKRTILSNIKLGGGVKARIVHGGCYISQDDLSSPQLAESGFPSQARTYYGVEMKENYIFEPYLELGVDITEELYLYGEASIRQFHLQAENGWYKHMYGAPVDFTPQEHYTLAKIRETNFCLGIAVGGNKNGKSVKLYMGITILNRPELFSVAKDIQIDYSNISFFVGLAIGGDFTFKII